MITHEDYKMALQGYIGLVEVSVPQNKSGKHLSNIATMINYGNQQVNNEKLLELYKKFVDGLLLKADETWDTFGVKSDEEVLRSKYKALEDFLIWDLNLVNLFKQIKKLEEEVK